MNAPTKVGARRGAWAVWHAMVALAVVVLGPWLSLDADATDLARVYASPSWTHPCGCDDTGRDVLARAVRGARTTIGASLVGVALAALVGTALGALAGSRRGIVDAIVMRAIEAFVCFPTLLVLLLIGACFGSSPLAVSASFAVAMWPSFARVVRGELLSLREREYVQTARELGVRGPRLFTGHVLPQLRGQVAVVAAFCMASAIVAESTLSFLGIGPGPQSGSWGAILAQGKANLHVGVWHLWVIPGALISSCVLCCHALAERMRPRS
jgi:ABC-type dipeptide/oligopeptide/nickel transport system permease subunit